MARTVPNAGTEIKRKYCCQLHRSFRRVLGGNVRFATTFMLRSPLNHYRQQSPLETQRRARDFFAKAAICNSATVRIEKRMGRAKVPFRMPVQVRKPGVALRR